MVKIINPVEAAALVNDGDSVMVGGFMDCGSPDLVLDALLAKGIKNLTVISNDHARTGFGLSKLVAAKSVSKAMVTHIGLNPESGKQMAAKELDIELIPQGTLAERIRCGGFGLGGVLTPTGVGTTVAEGKQVLRVNGRDYLLELPLRAKVALIKAHKADKQGNLVFRRAARNFNPLMAAAADLVIAEVEEIVEIGQLDPDVIHTPGIFIHYLVKA
ncbi:MAG: 3-oxoacid CoA-transferase subunit A [Deltaproteobacteria bacterium]|jgi:acetate CoA/acetoacetate CoA-transferase alpha subunit|nr:3-oxoacid CoA-transferase subunit A [Deltaproteobacteria bacterium]